MKFDFYEYNLSGHFLSALINNDYSGLDDNEADTLNSWLAGLPAHGHWDIPRDELGSEGAFSVCDICQVHAICYVVRHYFAIREA